MVEHDLVEPRISHLIHDLVVYLYCQAVGTLKSLVSLHWRCQISAKSDLDLVATNLTLLDDKLVVVIRKPRQNSLDAKAIGEVLLLFTLERL